MRALKRTECRVPFKSWISVSLPDAAPAVPVLFWNPAPSDLFVLPSSLITASPVPGLCECCVADRVKGEWKREARKEGWRSWSRLNILYNNSHVLPFNYKSVSERKREEERKEKLPAAPFEHQLNSLTLTSRGSILYPLLSFFLSSLTSFLSSLLIPLTPRNANTDGQEDMEKSRIIRFA